MLAVSEDIINDRAPLRSLIDDDDIEVHTGDIMMDHDYLPDSEMLSEFSSRAVTYIAGFIVCSLQRRLKCATCVDALSTSPSTECAYSLIKRKSLGGLLYPSDDVIQICRTCE